MKKQYGQDARKMGVWCSLPLIACGPFDHCQWRNLRRNTSIKSFLNDIHALCGTKKRESAHTLSLSSRCHCLLTNRSNHSFTKKMTVSIQNHDPQTPICFISQVSRTIQLYIIYKKTHPMSSFSMAVVLACDQFDYVECVCLCLLYCLQTKQLIWTKWCIDNNWWNLERFVKQTNKTWQDWIVCWIRR